MTMTTMLPYHRAFDRIRAEFLEMPGMRLTPRQVERLAGIDRAACQAVLDDLVRSGFLGRWPDGSYGRSTDATTSRVRSATAVSGARDRTARHAR
jgi:hypothetical protein